MKTEVKRSVEELSFQSKLNSLNEVVCDTLQTLVPPNDKVDKILIQARGGDIYFSLDGSLITQGQGYKLLETSEPLLIPQMQNNILKVIGSGPNVKLIYSWGY